MKRTIELAPGETIEFSVRPGVAGFLDLYVAWSFVGVLAALVLVVWPDQAATSAGYTIREWLVRLFPGTRPGLFLATVVYLIACTFVYGVVAMARSELKWLLLGIAPGIALLVVGLSTTLPLRVVMLYPIGLTVVAFTQIEVYRRSHSFYMTNHRLIFRRTYPLAPRMITDAYFHHITNVAVRSTAVERLFGAGSVIPIMASGLNVGSDIVNMEGHFLVFTVGGSREKRLPRAIPYLCFFSIRKPEEIAVRISYRVATGE